MQLKKLLLFVFLALGMPFETKPTEIDLKEYAQQFLEPGTVLVHHEKESGKVVIFSFDGTVESLDAERFPLILLSKRVATDFSKDYDILKYVPVEYVFISVVEECKRLEVKEVLTNELIWTVDISYESHKYGGFPKPFYGSLTQLLSDNSFRTWGNEPSEVLLPKDASNKKLDKFGPWIHLKLTPVTTLGQKIVRWLAHHMPFL